jgi:hypothetical protein
MFAHQNGLFFYFLRRCTMTTLVCDLKSIIFKRHNLVVLKLVKGVCEDAKID